MTNQEFSDYIRRNFKISFDIKNWKEDALWAKVIEFGVPIEYPILSSHPEVDFVNGLK